MRRTAHHRHPAQPGGVWWRDATFYEVYLRSFADTNADGVGDLEGVRSRLGYLNLLGVDALWLTPFFRSPMVDHGYDVSDPRDVDPLFGDLSAVDLLIADAHQRGMRVIIDVVPNHTSTQHEWFQAALAAPPAAGNGHATSSGTAAVAAAHSRQTTGPASSVVRPGRGCHPARPVAGSGTCTCSPRNRPT